jgi:endonuclease-3
MSRDAQKKLKLRKVLAGLVRMYGAAPGRRVRRGAGLDTLVEAMLAQNTNMANAVRGYRMLRRRFATWAEVLAAPVGDVQREIAICGLARMRARRLQDLLRTIQERRGRLSIDFLARETPESAFEYLMGFYGIGPKTAAFTLLFGFGHPVLPVDNGVLRVVRRLRLVRAKARDLEAERVLSPLIAKGDHYPTHVLLFRHAKERCRPRNPKCAECKLVAVCPYGQRRVKHRPPAEVEEPVRKRLAVMAGYVSAGIGKVGTGEDSRES